MVWHWSYLERESAIFLCFPLLRWQSETGQRANQPVCKTVETKCNTNIIWTLSCCPALPPWYHHTTHYLPFSVMRPYLVKIHHAVASGCFQSSFFRSLPFKRHGLTSCVVSIETPEQAAEYSRSDRGLCQICNMCLWIRFQTIYY